MSDDLDKKTEPEFWEKYRLAQEYRGTWQYRMTWGGKWYHANTKSGAVDMAKKLFDRTPESERLTPQQICDARELEFFNSMHAVWRRYSDEEIEGEISNLKLKSKSFHSAANREFDGNGGRRTSAAVSAEAMRESMQCALNLSRYLSIRKNNKAS